MVNNLLFRKKIKINESVVQNEKYSKKRLNKTNRVKHRFCEGKEDFA